MFDPPSHEVTHNSHNTHVSNPLNNNGARTKFHQTSWNIAHIPKEKQTDPRNYQALALEELPRHL